MTLPSKYPVRVDQYRMWYTSYPVSVECPAISVNRYSPRISGISRERQIQRGLAMSQSGCYVNLRVATGRTRGGFKTRFPGGRRIQGNIPCGGDTRIPHPAALLRRRSERVHLAVEVGDRGRQGRGAGRQAETLQNFSCRVGRMNCGKNFHPAAATFTLKNVHQENTFHQLRPGIVATARRWQRVRCGLGINSRRR